MHVLQQQILIITIDLFSGGRGGFIMFTRNIFKGKKCLYLLNFTDLYWILRMDLTQVTKKRFSFKCLLFTVSIVLSGVLTLFKLDQVSFTTIIILLNKKLLMLGGLFWSMVKFAQNFDFSLITFWWGFCLHCLSFSFDLVNK